MVCADNVYTVSGGETAEEAVVAIPQEVHDVVPTIRRASCMLVSGRSGWDAAEQGLNCFCGRVCSCSNLRTSTSMVHTSTSITNNGKSKSGRTSRSNTNSWRTICPVNEGFHSLFEVVFSFGAVVVYRYHYAWGYTRSCRASFDACSTVLSVHMYHSA